MEYRVGLCSACGASFKVPASFSAGKAKCKVCGGVVDIGAVRSDAGGAAPAPPPVPARRPQARPASGAREPQRPTQAPPPKAKSEVPSMKERLLAQRRAAEAAATPSAIPARRIEEAAGRGSGAKPMQVTVGGATRAAAGAPTGKIAPGARKPVAGAAARTSAAGASGAKAGSAGGRRRGARATEEADRDAPRGRRGRSRAREKQSPALMLGAGALVLVAAAAGVWFVFFTDHGDDSKPAEGPAGTAQAAAPIGAAGDSGEAIGTRDAGDPAAARDGSARDRSAPEGSAGEGAAPEEAALEGGAPAPATPAAAARPRAQGDPDSVDLLALEEFGPLAGTSDEEWRRIRDLVATALDNESGIAGSRARRELEELGKAAFPAIINAMRHIDYRTESGYQDGDVAQRILRTIANGRNFDWRYSTEPADVYFNKRAVQSYHQVWSRARNDEAYWKEFAKITDKPAEGAEAGGRLTEDELDDLDDL